MKQVHQIQRRLTCNWKVAHDNTLDDYHVAVAHPTTLHREQGPVKDYVHRFTEFGNVLITPCRRRPLSYVWPASLDAPDHLAGRAHGAFGVPA